MTTMIADPPTSTTWAWGSKQTAKQRSSCLEKEHWDKTRCSKTRLASRQKPRWDRIGVSAGVQLAILAFVLLLPLIFPQQLKTALHFQIVELARPVTENSGGPSAPPPKVLKVKAPEPVTRVVEPLKLEPQKPHIFITQPKAVVQPKVQPVEAKAPVLDAHFEAAKIDTATERPEAPQRRRKGEQFEHWQRGASYGGCPSE